ncbi:MAG: D-glycero-beta-D-manno-heptose-7-phosphate kinase [Acidobacteria bacterium]|nr:D-glycero-beta-D-manno-heptose-7-phosphate kinase [Acidobacteriota bacterium]
MKKERVAEILSHFSRQRIIVLGDLMLDEFIWGEVRRISPEAPVPVVEVRRETILPGGSGNVVSNLIELGATAIPVGIVGDDEGGRMLREICSTRGAPVGAVLTVAGRPTTRKTRIVAHSQQMVRADREDRSPVDQSTEEQILEKIEGLLPLADALIISDYEKGLLTPHLLRQVVLLARRAGRLVCLDPKLRHFTHYREVDLVTPNQNEAERAAGIEIVDAASLTAAAYEIRRLIDCRHVLITRGEHGMTLLEESGRITNIPTTAREVYDVTGAGDTVIATLTLALTAGASPVEAAMIANQAAGLVVAKVGTATTSLAEILNFNHPD